MRDPVCLSTKCDISLSICALQPCLNGATCTDAFGVYACGCAPGYRGTNCEIDINECAANPCQNGGTCVDGIAGRTCECPDGVSGSDCEITAMNDSPVAVDDRQSTNESTDLVLPFAMLIGNDVDPDGPSLTITAVSNVVGGSVALGASSVTFSPTLGFAGTAEFDYTLSDGSNSTDVGHVTVTVNAVASPCGDTAGPSSSDYPCSCGDNVLTNRRSPVPTR